MRGVTAHSGVGGLPRIRSPLFVTSSVQAVEAAFSSSVALRTTMRVQAPT
jgi:hypothetical protein